MKLVLSHFQRRSGGSEIGFRDVVGALGIFEGPLRDGSAFNQQSGPGSLSLGKGQVGFRLVELGGREVMSRPRRLDGRLQLRLYPHDQEGWRSGFDLCELGLPATTTSPASAAIRCNWPRNGA